jgi:DNA-binding response OmpR family regulator
MEQKPVLIVEDDREIAQVITMNIEDLGLTSEHVTDGRAGLQKALGGGYSLVILDIMLPKMDGISVCTHIREKDPQTPILMLTARADEIDRVLGLELGADDYMTKPFSLRELTARIKALLRRSQNTKTTEAGSNTPANLTIGDLSVDFNKRKIILSGNVLDVTVKEFDLLSIFVRNPGRAFSRAELLNLIWEYQFDGYEHTVNTHINRIRNKIEEDASHPKYLKTVWGVGYRFAEAEEFST